MLRRTRSALSCEFQGFANPSQFPTELLFSTIYVLSLPIIPGLPVIKTETCSKSKGMPEDRLKEQYFAGGNFLREKIESRKAI